MSTPRNVGGSLTKERGGRSVGCELRERPIAVECDVCRRTQLRWSNGHSNGLKLDEIYDLGWTWDGTTWRCPFCQLEGEVDR